MLKPRLSTSNPVFHSMKTPFSYELAVNFSSVTDEGAVAVKLPLVKVAVGAPSLNRKLVQVSSVPEYETRVQVAQSLRRHFLRLTRDRYANGKEI
jgi:hypothetical protein